MADLKSMDSNDLKNNTYAGFKVRFAKLASWLDIDPENKQVCIKKICQYLTTKMADIEDISNGKFSDGKIDLKEGLYGGVIELPSLNLQLDDNKIDVNILLRINPCFLFDHDETTQHYSKVWVNIQNSYEQNFNNKDIQNILKKCRKIGKDLAQKLGQYYVESCEVSANKDGCTYQGEMQDYWISIESATLKRDKEKNEALSPLFYTGDEDTFKKQIKEATLAKRALADVVEWFYDAEVIEPISYLKKNKKKIKWKVSATDEAKIFYGQNNTDNFFHLIGLGIAEGEDTTGSQYLAADSMLLPTVAIVVAAL